MFARALSRVVRSMAAPALSVSLAAPLTRRAFAAAAAGPAPHAKKEPPAPVKFDLFGIRHVVAVASGKGGVGKSTTAVNLAIALSQLGQRVGICDCDVYGPSVPRMMNVMNAKPKFDEASGKIDPVENYGVKVMSIGFITGAGAPTIWRGPLVSAAIEQFFRSTKWGVLDVLIVDMPPGTGDAQLTLSQRVPLTGAVIVSTPQAIALEEAVRGTNMFKKVAVPVLGMVENMNGFCCPHCSETSYIFSKDGSKRVAADLGIDLLGSVPLYPEIRENADAGTPVALSLKDKPPGRVYAEIAQRLLDKIAAKPSGAGGAMGPPAAPAGPKITVE